MTINIKALILCGGKGTQLKPLTSTKAKHLLHVANKPILFYILSQVRQAGITDVGIVISPESGPQIKEALGDGSMWDTQISYILQPEPLGLAYAVKIARELLGDSVFFMFLGDNLIKESLKDFVQEFNNYNPAALILVKEATNPHLFGVAEFDANGKLSPLVEKPTKPKTNLALVGTYVFTPEIYKAIPQIKPSWRGELEITDAIQKLLDMGKGFMSHIPLVGGLMLEIRMVS